MPNWNFVKPTRPLFWTTRLLFLFTSFWVDAQEKTSNYKKKRLAVKDSIIIDSVSINPSRFIVKTKGGAYSSSDKSALAEAKSGIIPDPILLKARILFDGGYYQKANKDEPNYPMP